jgi:hypothetical protein
MPTDVSSLYERLHETQERLNVAKGASARAEARRKEVAGLGALGEVGEDAVAAAGTDAASTVKDRAALNSAVWLLRKRIASAEQAEGAARLKSLRSEATRTSTERTTRLEAVREAAEDLRRAVEAYDTLNESGAEIHAALVDSQPETALRLEEAYRADLAKVGTTIEQKWTAMRTEASQARNRYRRTDGTDPSRYKLPEDLMLLGEVVSPEGTPLDQVLRDVDVWELSRVQALESERETLLGVSWTNHVERVEANGLGSLKHPDRLLRETVEEAAPTVVRLIPEGERRALGALLAFLPQSANQGTSVRVSPRDALEVRLSEQALQRGRSTLEALTT